MKTLVVAIFLMGALLSGAVPHALAQKGEKTARVATLWTTTRDVAQTYIDGIEAGLGELGWVAGRNLAIRHFFTEAEPERLDALAAELVAWKPDVAIAALNTGAFAIRKQANTLPIVVSISYDPVGVGLAKSLARPGGRVTGMMGSADTLAAKRLQILLELAPGIRRLGVVWNTTFPGNLSARKAIDAGAAGLDITVIDGGVSDAQGFRQAFEKLGRERADAVFVVGDNLTFLRKDEIIAESMRQGWPAIFASIENCRRGGLVCYGINMPAQFRRSAVFVDKILRGTDPALIPFEQPMTFDFVINLKTARALNLTVPQSLLMMANRVIE